jgi:hypothetical protein
MQYIFIFKKLLYYDKGYLQIVYSKYYMTSRKIENLPQLRDRRQSCPGPLLLSNIVLNAHATACKLKVGISERKKKNCH